MTPLQPGFRHWLLENYRLVYGLDLIVAYASLMLYFASLVWIGRSSAVSRILLGILAASASVSALPFVSRYGDPERRFVAALRIRRPKETERVEIIIAVVLWAFIAIAAMFLFSRMLSSR